jgi:hypothetical protein
MTAVAKITPAVSTAPAAHGGDMISDESQFMLAQRWANAFASSQLVPGHLRGKPADCLIAMLMARELGDSPLMVMQSIYVVSGKAGWSATYMIARANRSGVFKGRITWETTGAGKDMTVKARAMLADTLETVSATTSMQMATAEGWTKNQKYQTMPELMLRYRAATMLIRLYCPEVMLGMHTADELETDNQPAIAAPQTVAASLDTFAAEGRAAEPETEDQPEPTPDTTFDWSAYAASVKADLAAHKTATALTADWDEVKERLANEGAPEEIRSALTTFYLETHRSLPRK